MAPDRHLQHVTLLLAVIASALLQIALGDRSPDGGLGLLGVSALLVVGLRFLAGRAGSSGPVVAAALFVSLLPLVWDPVARYYFWVGQPYEVQLAFVLRNAMFACAVAPLVPRSRDVAALASFFLLVFSFLWATGPVAITLLVLYAIAGAWWLLAAHWDSLGGRFADSSERAAPLRPAVAAIAVLALLALASMPLAGSSNGTTALAGFFPSSGGTLWSDPFAHGGVGDGDQMVAAKEQASSFGPIESELFLESQMPSLYDAISEFSEAAPKKTRKRRAIPLGVSDIQLNHKTRGMNQRPTREFSTVRRTRGSIPDTDDRLSAALLLVQGRTPQHLALETYDRWDGVSLIAKIEGEPLATELCDADPDGRRWLDLAVTYPEDAFDSAAACQVRVVNLRTNRVPTPSGVQSVTLRGLHAAAMFSFADDGSLTMGEQQIPQLTIIDFVSRLRGRGLPPRLARRLEGSEAEPGPAGLLAREWTAGVSPGWPQVEAVVRRLRADYHHDQSAMVPETVDDAVEHFLMESKRGPDYLFAASTAVMLRSLGYDTRVRSGFYARPDRYVRAARLTPVLAEDAHFWVEVRTSDGYSSSRSGRTRPGVWVTVEPTPGFKVLYTPETLVARCLRAVEAFCRVIAKHPVSAGLAVLAFAIAFATRRRLLDAALLAWWSACSPTLKSDRLARLTLRVLEWRAWTHRQGRPIGASLGRWETLRSHGDFLNFVSWALYGTGTPAPLPAEEARSVCRHAVRTRFTPRRGLTPIDEDS